VGAWFQTEAKDLARPDLTGEFLDGLLADARPEPARVRALAAGLAWSAAAGRPIPALAQRLGRVQLFLETHESLLPVRAVWLAWAGLVQLSEGDVLALARVRDRLLERLYHHGLSPDLDLPSFLRFSGLRTSDRFRAVRDQILRLKRLVLVWVGEDMYQTGATAAYADLTFAFGLARLDERAECEKLLDAAQEALAHRDEIHTWLAQAYAYRVRQARDGKANVGGLPAELVQQLEPMAAMPRYKVDRLRERSRILEPHERIDPYRHWIGRYYDALSRELAGLFDVTDRVELQSRLTRLLPAGRMPGSSPSDMPVLAAALDLAPRIGEAFAREVLGRVEPALDATPGMVEQAALLEKGLLLAAHFDQTQQVQALVARFHQMLASAQGAGSVQGLESLAGQCFRGLRKFGMRDAIGRLLEQVAELIRLAEPQAVQAAGRSSAAGRAPANPHTLKLLLHVAAGWYYFGQNDRAKPIVDQVRHRLFQGDPLAPKEQADLACAYIAALGQAPVEVALQRLEELFHRLARIPDSFTTATHYSRLRLDVVEAMVLAVVNDDFALDTAGRQWLDNDEFLVRRRIHRDVRTCLARAGL
jgi:hypothetical protein